ncbi:hypothetical protein ACFV6F_08980 [Kitasatospora phosalacinea]|uniref:hypothetical protein n=1 Tax=Kitasatospora phosalacinea TaxID=2065 RepID=UPI003651325B
MNRRGPRRSRRRARAAQLGISLYELEQAAFGRGGAEPPAPRSGPERAAEPVRCCSAEVTRRVALGGTVMVTSVHELDCGVWGPER